VGKFTFAPYFCPVGKVQCFYVKLKSWDSISFDDIIAETLFFNFSVRRHMLLHVSRGFEQDCTVGFKIERKLLPTNIT
jgi:hypothetical protein